MPHGRAERSWSTSVFGFVAQGRVQRRASDGFRVGFAVVGVVATAAYASRAGQLEATVLDLIHEVPDLVQGFFRTFVDVLYALALAVTVLALIARRLRLAGTVALAAGVAAAACWAAGPLFDVDGARDAAGYTANPPFPSAQYAVLAAAVLAALPYLTRPARRVAAALLPLAGLGAIFLGDALPSDAIAALWVAWGSAAIAHLVFGSPAGTPTTSEVTRALAALDVPHDHLELVEDPSWGATRFVAEDDGDALDVKVFGRDATDAQLATTAWRMLWYKDAGTSLALSRSQRVEH